MIDGKEQSECSGCGVCAAVCPTAALAMKPDKQGFFYPSINVEKCIECNKCLNICPFNKLSLAQKPLKVYAARHRSDEVCMSSTSGGMFSAISDYFLETKGVIYAAMFDVNMKLAHIRIDTKALRNNARGSKYVQSDISQVFGELLKDLKNGRKVAFFGTPCQVAAIKTFVPKEYVGKLFVIDVICNGVGAPKVWEKFVERIENQENKKVTNYNFRPKTKGYQTHSEIAYFEDGTHREYTYALDRFNSIYYSGLIMRPSCFNCKFCDKRRISDITIADFSSLQKEDAPFNIQNGVSTLMINTPKGNDILDFVSPQLYLIEKSVNELEQERLERCSMKNPEGEKFLVTCISKGIVAAINERYSIIDKAKLRVADIIEKKRKE